MKFMNRINAWRRRKGVFRVPDLNRICFADSLTQCASKYTGHTVCECGRFQKIIFIITGKCF